MPFLHIIVISPKTLTYLSYAVQVAAPVRAAWIMRLKINAPVQAHRF